MQNLNTINTNGIDMYKENNKASISEKVYDHLMQMVLSMEMKPGAKISEEKISKEFGCSRAPIREALKRLSHEGVVNLYPKRYAEVGNYSDDLIKQIGVVRVFMDIMAIKLVMIFGSNADIMKMREHADQCLEAAERGDTALRIRKDCDFHLELSKISKNQQLCKFANELYIRIEFIQATRYVSLENPQEQWRQHCEIIDLLLNRDEMKAIELIARHDSNFHGISNDFPINFFIKT